ncbi:hypothetical protein [Sphingomonas sp. TREG-RG-20F-R18-01]|uniref:hypothetical protein n=1 Tax=Sphingomonas sp. TREG-RG-20F-R18-01 TaxID=2914982 RepID=UPI001F57A691|nr:hypothetical protein [Sphingomonas sp. TREG-RG-20F-R18-01]
MAMARTGNEDQGWYVRNVDAGHGQLWRITDRTATLCGISNPEAGAGTYYAADPDETIWKCLRRLTPWLDGSDNPGPFRRMILAPGQYHCRVARPIVLAGDGKLSMPDARGDERYITDAQNQLESLIDALTAICRVVQPSPATFAAYGHEIRNILILASTEVEMHWRGILKANGGRANNSGHYLKLADPLLLRDYVVRFYRYPDIDPIAPFAGWSEPETSKSLSWYAAYNGVKHNREFEFEKATLANAFGAIAACAVILVAQFGQEALTSDLRRFLAIDVPMVPIEEMYIMPQEGKAWTPLPLFGLG